jgi:hypothetical protein
MVFLEVTMDAAGNKYVKGELLDAKICHEMPAMKETLLKSVLISKI